jgi:serine phosphatase RsbU (regulator of sigma subunit)
MKTRWLHEMPLLSEFSDDDIERLSTAFHWKEFAPATILFREGDVGDCFTMVLRGQIEIIKALGTKEERLLALIGPGDYLGEMSLLDPSGLRSASARTRGIVEWAEITRQDFTALLESYPILGLRLLQEMISRLRRSEAATIQDLQAKNQALAQAYSDLQQAQSALIEKEKLLRELEIAHTIQESILPEGIPDLPGWRIAVHWQPAQAVGGDFYDVLPYPDGGLGLLMADVSGKGVPAALVMATTCSTLRAIARSDMPPGAILEQVNHLILPNIPPNMFVTCLYGILDPASGNLRFANAGHNLPIMSSVDGVRELRATGMPLGLLPGITYEEKSIQFQPGDKLLLYTDGITEAHNNQGEMFGLPRLHNCLVETPCNQKTIDYLWACLSEFTGSEWEQEDDVTFLTLVREPITLSTSVEDC